MTIFALCCFAAGLDPDPDAAAEALRAAGYEVFRLPPELKATLEIQGDDFIEVRGKGNDDEDSRNAMEADVNRIVDPFGGEIDCSAFLTIAEMWAPSPPVAPTAKTLERRTGPCCRSTSAAANVTCCYTTIAGSHGSTR